MMKKFIKLIALCTLVVITASCQQKIEPFLSEYPEIDLLITNGSVLDGLGNEAVLADVVIVDDQIVFVGKTAFTAEELKLRVKNSIDAKQNIVAPGFIQSPCIISALPTAAMSISACRQTSIRSFVRECATVTVQCAARSRAAIGLPTI